MVYPFVLPRVVCVGQGALYHLGTEMERLGARKALVITDKGIIEAGLHAKVLQLLKSHHINTTVYSQVEPEPSSECVEQAAEIAREGVYDVIVGLGGGSAMDVAKGASILATNGGRIRDYIGIEAIPVPGLPTVLVATTAGTGAEVTMNAIFTFKDEKVKKGVVSRYLLATVAIVDPELTATVPPHVTAATGMDALVHAIESFTAVKATHHTDLYALEAISLISGNLRRAVACGSDMEARSKMALGSFLAGVSLANAGVGAVHALAYPLGGRFQISHGVANALLLPTVMEFNLIGNLEKFAAVGEAMGESIAGKSVREAALAAVKAVRELSLDVGIPQSMKEVGVTESGVEELIEGALQQTRLLNNNPRSLTKEDIRGLYLRALG